MMRRLAFVLLTILPLGAIAQQESAARRTIDVGDSSDDRNLGRTTQSLLQAQASGTYAGKRLPIPGDEASASYRRYLRSFDHEIPAFFETKVQRSAESGQ